MALKITQIQLKRKYRAEIVALKDAIHLACYECMGNQADGYIPCTDTVCPLYPFRLRKSIIRSNSRLCKRATALKKLRRGAFS